MLLHTKDHEVAVALEAANRHKPHVGLLDLSDFATSRPAVS
jgi:hypothetical protein